jgi:hypothetical protein
VAIKIGIVFGRPKSIITGEFKQVYLIWKPGEKTAVKAMQEIGIKKTTFYKLVKEYERELKRTKYYRRNSSKKVFAQRERAAFQLGTFLLQNK